MPIIIIINTAGCLTSNKWGYTEVQAAFVQYKKANGQRVWQLCMQQPKMHKIMRHLRSKSHKYQLLQYVKTQRRQNEATHSAAKFFQHLMTMKFLHPKILFSEKPFHVCPGVTLHITLLQQFIRRDWRYPRHINVSRVLPFLSKSLRLVQCT
jgi:hypothetical protein